MFFTTGERLSSIRICGTGLCRRGHSRGSVRQTATLQSLLGQGKPVTLVKGTRVLAAGRIVPVEEGGPVGTNSDGAKALSLCGIFCNLLLAGVVDLGRCQRTRL